MFEIVVRLLETILLVEVAVLAVALYDYFWKNYH